MKKTYLQKGFTLIELLVVIAIIGILSSVVLASLSTARNKANAVALVASLKSMQPGVAICNNDGVALVTTYSAGAAICTGSSTQLPPLTSLKATGLTLAAGTGSTASSNVWNITPAGHPVTACNALFVLTENSLTVPTGCN